MKFTFLGTGTSQGIPVIGCQCEVCLSASPFDKRLRTSGLLQSEHTTLVFDTGPDFREQMLRVGVKKLDAVVFTHSHRDHVAGLDDVRAYNFLQNRDMPVYGNRETLDHLKKEFYYIFENAAYPGVPRLQLHEIGDGPFQVGDIDLIPVPVLHGNMAVLGFRSGDFAYITDTNFIPASSMEILKEVKYLVLDALRIDIHHSHFNLEQAVNVIQEIRPERAWLIHISHLMGREESVSHMLPLGIELARDQQVFEW